MMGVGTSKPRGKRILCLDGGGMRGIIEIEILQEIEQRTGKKIHELFDLVCGTSTGGMLALGLGLQLIKPKTEGASLVDSAKDFYKALGRKIFTRNWWLPFSGFDTTQDKVLALFFRSKLRNILESEFGTKQLTQYSHVTPKVFVVSAVNWGHGLTPFLFRTYATAAFQSYDKSYLSLSTQFDCPQGYVPADNQLKAITVVDAALATSAAPGIFGSYGIKVHKNKSFTAEFSDGGVIANNPTELALFEASRLWPGEKIECIVSIGTGSADEKYWKESELARNDKILKKQIYQKWYNNLGIYFPFTIVPLITNSQIIHWRVRNWLSLSRSQNGTLSETLYFRFNPKNLPDEFGLSDAREETIKALEESTQIYLNSKGSKFRMDLLVRLLQGEKILLHQMETDWTTDKNSDMTVGAADKIQNQKK